MRAKDLHVGHEYRVSINGKSARARVVVVDEFYSDHLVEITRSPEDWEKYGQLYAVGSRTNLHSRSIKWPVDFVIHEEP